MSINRSEYSLTGDLIGQVNAAMDTWQSTRGTDRIWEKDAAVWTDGDEAKWLGWLSIVADEALSVDRFAAFHTDITDAGFEDVLLMGMGGSSLCPEVLSFTFGKTRFHILDSTVPAQVAAVEKKIDLKKTLFIVASKSGSTLEPNCFKQYFYDQLSSIVGAAEAGRQFVAITDPGSKMEQIAKDDGFRYIFYGKPDIGGRFSALSAFGLTAAASMGVDVKTLLDRASEMAEACRLGDPQSNPGALLGVVLGTCHELGRDKLTILAEKDVYDLGAWLEQLIAESTGKNGVAIIPVDREPLTEPELYGPDRLFVHVSVKGSNVRDENYHHIEAVERLGHPVIRIELESLYHIAQEFFRWEFATAVAGSLMKIDPFDQPDVEAAKIEARKLTDEYEATGKLAGETPFFEADGISLFSNDDNAGQLKQIVGAERTLSNFLKAHISRIEERDYFALLAYVEMTAANESHLTAIRRIVLDRNGTATCLGFGPRFLHSTGQAYKGGPNSGVFLQITCDHPADIAVPGQKYTFGVVNAAQARGDFQVLLDRGRRALRLHITGDVGDALQRIAGSL